MSKLGASAEKSGLFITEANPSCVHGRWRGCCCNGVRPANSKTVKQREKAMKTIVFATSILTAVLGCSTLSTNRTRDVSTVADDVRGATPLGAKQAEALMSGPALIKHLDTEGRGTVTLYLTDDPGSADRACPIVAGPEVTPIAIIKRSGRITDLVVPRGKRVCATLTEGRSTEVSWHAQSGTAGQMGPSALALLQR